MRDFYRIIKSASPTIRDFLTQRELRNPLRNPELFREWSEGISVLDDLDHARHLATRFPRLGSHLAVIRISSPPDLEIRQTTRDSHHFTMYAPAAELFMRIAGDAIPVALEDDNG